MKTCPDCQREFPRATFGRDRRTADGLRVPCRACRRSRAGLHAILARNMRRHRRTA